ncbi:MAG: MOSC domain-containing protein, partial [Myxococcota bacterium]|nr:MOSC domain-containing protein [Myxococcota bacterium]
LAAEADPSLSGDNLHVHLDISTDNLPVGSQLKIGTALFELTSEQHVPCHLFRQRFGQEAFSITEDPELAHNRLRGVFLKVVKAGSVQVGDSIEVTRRATD